MKISPLFDTILVKPEDVEQKSEGGIFLVADKTAPIAPPVAYGRVLAIGPGPVNDQGVTIHHPILVGDLVAYESGEGFEIMISAVPHVLLRVGHVLSKVES
jgi:chaperonin GroES